MPRAFLCHATEDKPTVERLARELMASGIDTFFDSWEIRAGQSLRQRIDAGIDGCTHFLVVLSATSLHKPWVNAELDAGFIAALSKGVQLIPLRIGMAPEQLPPLLSGMRSPSLDDFSVAAAELIVDILGVSRRPPIGVTPLFTQRAVDDEFGLSVVAGRIAAFLVRSSEKARWGDPQLPSEDLRTLAGVPDEDILEAIDELESRGWVEPSRALNAGSLGFVRVMPTPQLFAALDSALMSWKPAEDARTVGAAILNAPGGAVVVQLLAQQLGWAPRRINPAITHLVDAGAADHSYSHDANYQYYQLNKNVATRRFVRP